MECVLTSVTDVVLLVRRMVRKSISDEWRIVIRSI